MNIREFLEILDLCRDKYGSLRNEECALARPIARHQLREYHDDLKFEYRSGIFGNEASVFADGDAQ